MARRCKCKICGKDLTVDIAYKVEKHYYCSQDEYNSWLQEKELKKQKKELEKEEKQKQKELRNSILNLMANLIGTIFNNSTWGILRKTIAFLEEKYSLKDIYEYLIDDCNDIINILEEKEFSSEYAKVQYVTAIIRKHIIDYYILDDLEIIPQQQEEFYMAPIKYKIPKRKKSIVEIENEDDGDDIDEF